MAKGRWYPQPKDGGMGVMNSKHYEWQGNKWIQKNYIFYLTSRRYELKLILSYLADLRICEEIFYFLVKLVRKLGSHLSHVCLALVFQHYGFSFSWINWKIMVCLCSMWNVDIFYIVWLDYYNCDIFYPMSTCVRDFWFFVAIYISNVHSFLT